MTLLYDYNCLTNGLTFIHLKHIESLTEFVDDDEDSLVDKLKDDLRFEVTTSSGKTYICSVNEQFDSIEEEEKNLLEWRKYSPDERLQAIINQWGHV